MLFIVFPNKLCNIGFECALFVYLSKSSLRKYSTHEIHDDRFNDAVCTFVILEMIYGISFFGQMIFNIDGSVNKILIDFAKSCLKCQIFDDFML